MKENGMTLREISSDIKCSREYLSRVKNRKLDPPKIRQKLEKLWKQSGNETQYEIIPNNFSSVHQKIDELAISASSLGEPQQEAFISVMNDLFDQIILPLSDEIRQSLTDVHVVNKIKWGEAVKCFLLKHRL